MSGFCPRDSCGPGHIDIHALLRVVWSRPFSGVTSRVSRYQMIPQTRERQVLIGKGYLGFGR